MTTTIRDIASHLGISPSTVSRGLNGRPGLSAEVRQEIVATAQRLGYRPSGIARALRSQATKTLGLIVPSILNPFFTDLAHAAEVASRAQGLSLVIGNSDEDPAIETEYLRVMMEQRVDGLLIAPSRDENAMLAELAGSGLPMVFLDRTLPGLGVPSVTVDAGAAIDALARHIAALGHRRAGIVRGPKGVAVARQRDERFVLAGQAAGLSFAPQHQIHGDFNAEGGAAAFARMVQDPPDAVFITNNLMTQGFLQAAAQAGVIIGRDIAVASFDDTPLFQLYNPPITAIVQPTRLMGITGVEMLIRRLRGQDVDSIQIQAEVALRSSCGERGVIL